MDEPSEDRLHLSHAGACRTAFRVTPEACGRVLLVGEDNPLSSAPEHALFCHPPGCAGARLQSDILGVSRATYLALWRTNLCSPKWSAPAARDRAHDLLFDAARPWSTIVLLGRKVADVFARVLEPSARSPLSGKRAEFSPFSSTRLDDRGRWVDHLIPQQYDVTIVSLPHPSGRNLLWNDARRIADARVLLAEVVPEIAWGGE